MGKESHKRFMFLMVVLLGVAIVSLEAKGKGGIRGGGGLRDGDGIGIVPGPDEKVFNVLDFDATADGETDNQEAFMGAFRAACDHPGKARFFVPPGIFAVSQVPFVGPCKGPGPMVVQIAGTLNAVTDLSIYSEPEWLVFERHQGLVIFGGGIVDGQGPKVWKYNDCSKKSDCARLSSSIVLKNVTNGFIRRITSLNPMGFHFFITNSRNVRLQRLLIRAPADSPNTDGVHISSSDQVKLAQLRIETGDDCVGILQGSTEIAINKVFCGPGHGISIGSLGKYEDEEDVRGVRVRNCTLRNTDNGLRIKTFPFKPNVRPIKASGLVFSDIVMENVKNPIIIDQEYCGNGHSCVQGASKIRLSDIFFQNVRGTTISPEAISIKCSSAEPCQNVHLHDINLNGINGPAAGSCTNAKLNFLGLQIPPVKC